MINPTSTSENLMFNTVRIKTKDSVGTGFFFEFKIEEKKIPVIITNKHVITNNTSTDLENMEKDVTLFLHACNEENRPSDLSLSETISVNWFFHPTHDLCFCLANPIFEAISKKQNQKVFYIFNGDNIILDDNQLKSLRAIEEVVMIGYPNGLWDEENNLPLFRKGITSSHPAIDFNRKSIGVIDMACFKGSSGSPIFILNEDGYMDKNGNINIGNPRLIFLGILFEGPYVNQKGELIIGDVPIGNQASTSTPQYLNLGYYIKAHELREFREIIVNLIKKGS